MLRPPPISTLFPYTTLFRSHGTLPGRDSSASHREGLRPVVPERESARRRRAGGTRVRGPEDADRAGRGGEPVDGGVGDPRNEDEGRAAWGRGRSAGVDRHLEGPAVGPLVGGIPRAGAGGTRSHAGGKPPGGALGEVSPPPAGGPVS